MAAEALVVELIRSNHNEVLQRLQEHNQLDEKRFADIGVSVNTLRVEVNEMATSDAVTKALNSDQIARAAGPMQTRSYIINGLIVGVITGAGKMLEFVFNHWGAIMKVIGHL